MHVRPTRSLCARGANFEREFRVSPEVSLRKQPAPQVSKLVRIQPRSTAPAFFVGAFFMTALLCALVFCRGGFREQSL